MHREPSDRIVSVQHYSHETGRFGTVLSSGLTDRRLALLYQFSDKCFVLDTRQSPSVFHPNECTNEFFILPIIL